MLKRDFGLSMRGSELAIAGSINFVKGTKLDPDLSHIMAR